MERLDITAAPERANIEAAIHFARYAIAKDLVRGKRVLDIACGEGYGSYLLKHAGADSVVGVDISSESVERANRSFASNGLEFIASDVKELDRLFDAGSFDLIISIETIEHVENPQDFLKSLKRLSKPDGVTIISCPNDHWYYPKADQSNPYHRRKYRFEEFQDLCVPILGENVQWTVGTGVLGFASTSLEPEASYEAVPGTWMSFQDVPGSYLVHGKNDFGIEATHSSYFVGVWNAPGPMPGGAVFPLAMDVYEGVVQAQYGFDWFQSVKVNLQQTREAAQAEGAKAQMELQQARDELDALKRDQRRVGLMFHAVQAENEAISQAMRTEHARRKESEALLQAAKVASESLLQKVEQERDHYRAECDRCRVGYERYIRLRKILPKGLRSWIVRVVKSTRGGRA